MKGISLASMAIVCIALSGLTAKAATFNCTWFEKEGQIGKPVGNPCKVDSSAPKLCPPHTFSTGVRAGCFAGTTGSKTGLACIFVTKGSKLPESMTVEATPKAMTNAMEATPGYLAGAEALDVNADLTLSVGIKENADAPAISVSCM